MYSLNMPLHGRRGLQVEALFIGDHHIHAEGVGGVDWGGHVVYFHLYAYYIIYMYSIYIHLYGYYIIYIHSFL